VYRLQIKSSNEMLDQLGERFGEANVPVECDVVVEKTKQDVCEVVCRKAEELNAATLVLSTKKKNEVRCVFDRGELGWGCDSRTCLGAADGGYLLRQCGGIRVFVTAPSLWWCCTPEAAFAFRASVPSIHRRRRSPWLGGAQ
jgi:hypothetical protein